MSTNASSFTGIANALGYLMGIGSLMLYTPIAIRLYRQKTANGTTLSTWMMKVASYTCNDLYFVANHYPLSTYIDTLIITLEAAIVLALVTIYQHKYRDPAVWVFVSIYGVVSTLLYWLASPNLLAWGQFAAVALNSGALVPQFMWNMHHRTKGDYSPITALLAATGCAIRLWTVQELADNDVVLLLSFGIALVLNISLLLQILYYGTQVEELTLLQVLLADVIPAPVPAMAVPVFSADVAFSGDIAPYADLIHDPDDQEDDNDDTTTTFTTVTPSPSRFSVPDTAGTLGPFENYEMTSIL